MPRSLRQTPAQRSSPLIGTHSFRPAAGLAAALALGMLVAGGVSRDWGFASEPRVGSYHSPSPWASTPLPLRLVDLGAVGIPSDTAGWGHDYSHNTKVFHRLVLDSAPHVDEAEFRRLQGEWTAYVRRMARYGNNGVVVPLFLELVSFDGVPEIYAGTGYTDRHRVLRHRFRELFAIARDAGLQVYLATDMAPLTPPLALYLERLGATSATDSTTWGVYRLAMEELFDSLPEVRGVVIRVGEAGSLYNRADWPYRSRHFVGTIAGLRSMLRGLLPAFEAHHRSLILRSWSVGVGELGDLHTNPVTYARALGDIASPSLIVSTKFQAGDFFRPLTVNPTLLGGRHQRIIEFQARREFEGFSAFPNYLGPLHAGALQAIRSVNPRVVGSWLWTQSGGPLRAGPMSLYPLHGFWLWIDANAYVTSQLAIDPGRSPGELAADWVRSEVSSEPAAVEALTALLLRSSDVIDQGYYIRSFARSRVTFAGYELPPLFWIMEWDVVGGWSAVWSSIYDVTKPDMDRAVADGFEALAGVALMRGDLERAQVGMARRPILFLQMQRSLAYEESLLGALAWYRAAFFHYYRWLDTGDGGVYRRWREAGPEFRRRAEAHRLAFGGDLDFPAFDFSAGLRSVHLARRATETRWLVRGLLALMILSLLVGPQRRQARTVCWGALAPRDGRLEPLPGRSLLSATVVAIALFALTLSTMLSFTSLTAAAALAAVPATFLLVLKVCMTGTGHDQGDRIILIALGPVVWISAGLLAAMSIRGPHHLWFELWTGEAVRLFMMASLIGVPLWTIVSTARGLRRLDGFTSPAAIGTVTAAASAALLMLAILSPGLDQLLGGLDRPLGLAPMTYAVVIGIETYTRLPALASWYSAVLGALMAAGVLLRVQAATARRPASIASS